MLRSYGLICARYRWLSGAEARQFASTPLSERFNLPASELGRVFRQALQKTRRVVGWARFLCPRGFNV
jgi:hypothetical protein